MHTPCIAPCVAIPLHRPWWQRALDRLDAHRSRPLPRQLADPRDPATWRAHDLRVLEGLSERTLRDIGAPEWVRAESSAAARLGLDLMRL